MIGKRAAGTAISRRIVMAIEVKQTEVKQSDIENGGSLELIKDWARGVIKSVNWTKSK